MTSENKKEIWELNLEDLNEVSGGYTKECNLLKNWLKAHPDYAKETKRLLYSEGKPAATYYVVHLIESNNLPKEWIRDAAMAATLL